MLLYHGTCLETAQKILKEGILPRRDLGFCQSNYDKAPSNANVVYLTDTYAFYFGCNVTEKSDMHVLAIIEVDSERLSQECLLPDEDFLEQVSRGFPTIQDETLPVELFERTAWFRERLHGFNRLWTTSLKDLGTCGHWGKVAPETITRAVSFDMQKSTNRYIKGMLSDPCISLLNHRYCSRKYKALTRWFFSPMEDALEFSDFSTTCTDPGEIERFHEVLGFDLSKLTEILQDRSGLASIIE